MRELDLDNLSDEDKAWMKSRNMPIPGEDEDAEQPVPESIRPTAANDGALVDGNADDDSEDYAQWSNAKLREELGERDLPLSGTKAEMVARLQEDDSRNEQ